MQRDTIFGDGADLDLEHNIRIGCQSTEMFSKPA